MYGMVTLGTIGVSNCPFVLHDLDTTPLEEIMWKPGLKCDNN